MITQNTIELSKEEIEDLLSETQVKITYNPRSNKWRYEAQFNHLHIPFLEGEWRQEYEAALLDGYTYYQATS
ncbi:hypothetical protein [Rubritalea sp.]|uniref:hypothetical protein n=1 Tax=Rubritalea sp. TaxID=2109375 RepID=UPI003EF62699